MCTMRPVVFLNDSFDLFVSPIAVTLIGECN